MSEPVYASIESSNAQLLVLSNELKVVSWSAGMADITAGYKPTLGARLDTLPFPTARHQRQLVDTLASIVSEPGSVVMHREAALVAALHTKPNLVLHLQVPQEAPLRMTAAQVPLEIVLRMTAVRLRAPDGLAHVLVMGHEQIEPR